MSGIFISYRREDAADAAARIYNQLRKHFRREQIFMDIDTIEPGVDFVEVINQNVASCDALIAVIGKNWLKIKDKHRRRRLDDPDDFVRLEIEAALKRKVRVIPALVGGAAMPRAADLPEVLSTLARRQAIEISHNRFDGDIHQLIKSLERILASEKEKDLIVIDSQTGLMWTRKDNGKDINWHEANEYAKNLSLGGYRDWRLPTIEELEKLYDPQAEGRYLMGKPFEFTGQWVWSSTKEGSGSAWDFSLTGGRRSRGDLDASYDGRALCVRRSGE